MLLAITSLKALLLKYISVYFLAMLKFIPACVLGSTLGLSWIEITLMSVGGMLTSVAICTLLETYLIKRFTHKINKKPRVIQIWKKYGLIGVSFLTPILFSPILGTTIATIFGETRKKILVSMLISSIFWGIILSTLGNEIKMLLEKSF